MAAQRGIAHIPPPESKMRRGVESNFLKGLSMTVLMHALGSCVLAGHDVAAGVNGDGVASVHTTILA